MKTIKVDIDKRIRNKFQLFLCGNCFHLFFEKELADKCCKKGCLMEPVTEREYINFIMGKKRKLN